VIPAWAYFVVGTFAGFATGFMVGRLRTITLADARKRIHQDVEERDPRL
jgi:hypothetical protein